MKIDKEFAGIIPPMTEEEYRGLETSILAEGCRDALVCWGEILVDGHNRYRICEEHGIEYRTVEREFSGRDEVMLWIMQNQLSRRNLNDFQRIEIVRKCENAVKAQARERQLSELKQNQDTVKKNFSERGEQSRDTLGSMAGVSGVTYEHAVAIIDNAPEPVKEAVRKQEISINAGYETTKLPPEKQTEIATRIESGEKPKDAVKSVLSKTRPRPGLSAQTYERALHVIETAPEELKEEVRSGNISIAQAYKQVKEAERKAERQSAITEQLSQPKTSHHIDIFTTDKKYRVIYADPPWSYNDKQDTAKLGGAVKHYPTMPLDEICALPIPAEKNAVLFLWTTSPMLEDAFRVINAWGFKYKSSFVWDKISHAMGHYNSVRHEFLLVCVKGSCTPDVPKLYDSVVSIERTEHSRKPDDFRTMIDTLYPVGERLEMFAREASDGWDVWGNMA